MIVKAIELRNKENLQKIKKYRDIINGGQNELNWMLS